MKKTDEMAVIAVTECKLSDGKWLSPTYHGPFPSIEAARDFLQTNYSLEAVSFAKETELSGGCAMRFNWEYLHLVSY